MSHCSVSVLIPAYNAEAHLEHCLESVSRQSLHDIEIIIIDDGSDDSTAVIAEKYRNNDPRIKLIRLDRNQGVSIARNTGLDHASGEFIIYLDADDFWLCDDLLEKIHTRATNKQADIVRFGFLYLTQHGVQRMQSVPANTCFEPCRDTGWSIPYNIWCALIRRTLISQHNLRFMAELKLGEDALFCYQLYCNATRVCTCSLIGYAYRQTPNSINTSPWTYDKLFSTVYWFRHCINTVLASKAYSHYPEILQQLVTERLAMLYNRLGPVALDILNDDGFTHFIDNWSECLAYADRKYLETRMSSTKLSPAFTQLLNHVINRDIYQVRQLLSTSINEK